MDDDPFDLKNLALPEAPISARQLESTAPRVPKRKKQFVKVPMPWVDRLDGATGQSYRVALLLLYEGWRASTNTVKLGNSMVAFNGVSRQSKWRALTDLEKRGLIKVERRPKKSPLVHFVLQI
jgi:hypothetical protein